MTKQIDGGGYHVPFAKPSIEVDDRLGASDVTEAGSPVLEHLISSLWQETTDIHIGLATLVLQGAIQRLQR